MISMISLISLISLISRLLGRRVGRLRRPPWHAHLMREAIRGPQRQSEVIRGYQRSSEVIRG